jgi:hypothetical protein
MDNYKYTNESASIANIRADEAMKAHENGVLTDKEYCDECTRIVMDMVNLDIKRDSKKRGAWIKEKLENDEKNRNKKVDYRRHISFVCKPTRFKIY